MKAIDLGAAAGQVGHSVLLQALKRGDAVASAELVVTSVSHHGAGINYSYLPEELHASELPCAFWVKASLLGTIDWEGGGAEYVERKLIEGGEERRAQVASGVYLDRSQLTRLKVNSADADDAAKSEAIREIAKWAEAHADHPNPPTEDELVAYIMHRWTLGPNQARGVRKAALPVEWRGRAGNRPKEGRLPLPPL